MRAAGLFDDPKAKTTYDDHHVICPYCGHRCERDAESINEHSRIEECEECGKKYHRSEMITVSTQCEPDCALNGEEHAWAVHEYGKERRYVICDGCGKHGPRSLLPENARGGDRG